MRKEVIKRFLFVLILAIGVTGILFLVTVSVQIRNTTKEDMRLNLLVLDSGLDYEGNLQKQIEMLPATVDTKTARYTIFDLDGHVLADTYMGDYDLTESHADRIEFRDTFSRGIGYSNRYSKTLNKMMFYTAIRSSRSDYILRIAIPFNGNSEYFVRLLPAFLLSITVAFIIALISAERLVRSLTTPFQSIVDVMEGYDKNHMELKFEKTPFEELNIITDAAVNMSESIKDYARQLEFERMTREEFFANASHELKTPVTSIRGYVELLLGGFAVDKETQIEFMNRVLKETEHITTLVNDILMIAELESEEYIVTISNVRVAIILEDVIHSCEILAKNNNITITSECIPVKVVANEQHIRQILMNLVGNAVKYNRPNGSVHVSIQAEEDNLIIKVSDTGVGISKEAQLRVFERFYRVDKGRSRKVGGTGLGLSIVKHIANYYHGSISVESEINIGSTFTCILPKIIV